MLTLIRCVLLFLCSMPLWSSTNWYTLDDKDQAVLNVELFLSSTCPYCHKEQIFFTALASKLPWIRVRYHIINQDKAALSLFNQLLIEQQANDFSVPSAFFCNSRWVGFDSGQTTGNELLKALVYCKKQIEKKGGLVPSAVETLNRWANANKFINGMTSQPTPLHYTLMVVFLDAFNPCALYAGTGFLAVLFLLRDKKNKLISGSIYIGVLVLLHYFQQIQASAFFQILSWSRPIAFIVGIGSLYLVYLYYKKRAPKPVLLFIWTFAFSVITLLYQQSCLMNWSYIFQQWIDNHSFSPAYKLFLQGLYQLLYALPFMLILLGSCLLPLLKRFVTYTPYLEYLSWIYIVIIAGFLIVYPHAMANYWLSFFILLIATVLGFMMGYYQQKKKKLD
ncbi:MAG: hypothetical protein CK426_01400 [Legionella sp.]|nr:MAG: hypothetical protein CK423_08680 [Legionella sp.]PJD99813.1 MAG: hypothetical protein CK426_01400 [Legionella sp.]